MMEKDINEQCEDFKWTAFFYYIFSALLYFCVFQMTEQIADFGHLEFFGYAFALGLLRLGVLLYAIFTIWPAIKINKLMNDRLLGSFVFFSASILCFYLLCVVTANMDRFKPLQLDIDRYHQEYEELCYQNPYILGERIHEDPAYPALYMINDEYYMERQNDGVFSNDFSFEMDLAEHELRIPEKGNGVFFGNILKENRTEMPVFGIVKTNKYRPKEKLTGTYDKERRMFVVALPEDMPMDGYGFAEMSIGTYTSRKLIGDRPVSCYQKLIYGGRYRLPVKILHSRWFLEYLNENRGTGIHSIFLAVLILSKVIAEPLTMIALCLGGVVFLSVYVEYITEEQDD